MSTESLTEVADCAHQNLEQLFNSLFNSQLQDQVSTARRSLINSIETSTSEDEEATDIAEDESDDNEIAILAQPLKDAVTGYLKEAQQSLPYKENVFYTIPQQVYHWCLLYINDSFPKMVHLDGYNVYQYPLYGDDPRVQYECVKQFRVRLSKPNTPPIREMIDSGVVPRIIELCQDHSHPELQYEALWVLLNIASGHSEAVAYVIRNNAHICLIDVLRSSPLYEIKDQAMYVDTISFRHQ